MTAKLCFGCMGWQEKDWVGPLYPEGTKAAEMLAKYSRVFPTVEVDSTFYGRPRETTVVDWRDSVPDDFRFALKVPRAVTHQKRFREVDEVFGWFVQRVRTLGPKLGAILLQCGRDFAPTPANKQHLYEFLDNQLPQDVNVVLELRHAGWYDDALFGAARSLRFALAATEGPHSSLELAQRILTEQGDALPFAYVRLMGRAAFEHYDRVQADRSESLVKWAKMIGEIRNRVETVYAYVSDDYAGHAPETVWTLLSSLGEPP